MERNVEHARPLADERIWSIPTVPKCPTLVYDSNSPLNCFSTAAISLQRFAFAMDVYDHTMLGYEDQCERLYFLFAISLAAVIEADNCQEMVVQSEDSTYSGIVTLGSLCEGRLQLCPRLRWSSL